MEANIAVGSSWGTFIAAPWGRMDPVSVALKAEALAAYEADFATNYWNPATEACKLRMLEAAQRRAGV